MRELRVKCDGCGKETAADAVDAPKAVAIRIEFEQAEFGKAPEPFRRGDLCQRCLDGIKAEVATAFVVASVGPF